MEIYISGLHPATTEDELERRLAQILSSLDINVFDIRKPARKKFAWLTIADAVKARKFLASTAARPAHLCFSMGEEVCFRLSRRAPQPHLLRILQQADAESSRVRSRSNNVERHQPANTEETHDQSIKFHTVQVGRWETNTDYTMFRPYHTLTRGGRISKQQKALCVSITAGLDLRCDLLVDSLSIHGLSLSKIGNLNALTISSLSTPKLFEVNEPVPSEGLTALIQQLSMLITPAKTVNRYRECLLPDAPPLVTGSCLTYRLLVEGDMALLKKRVQAMTSHRFATPMTRDEIAPAYDTTFVEQVMLLNQDIAQRKYSFGWRFQLHALWANGLLSPAELRRTFPTMEEIRHRTGEATLIKILQRLVLELTPPDGASDTTSGGWNGAIARMIEHENFLAEMNRQSNAARNTVSIHRVTVTPAGIYLYGPEEITTNRVLRQYSTHQDCFLRVLFADKNEERIAFDKDISNERVFQGRFLSVLRGGLDIAGEHFDFLGFSHSSLRTQTCWFMRPFVHQGTLMYARGLINQLGDFNSIHCPAKCAARIGQAFSETTSAMPVDPSIVRTQPDVQTDQHTFTDGCGTMSELTWRMLKDSLSSKDISTSYQIRYKGAKGMLTLDTRLAGHGIQLRESMIKFTGSPSDQLEVCGTNARAIPFRLNRQIIKILEDLKVPGHEFEALQERMIQQMRFTARSTTAAIDFLDRHMSGSAGGLPLLFRSLSHNRINVTNNGFFRDILGGLLQVELRQIKYRSRILVPDAVTLYGISDETAWLEPGQVFVTFIPPHEKKSIHLHTRVAVTRSPALHPGDIQVVQAVTPPQDSSLWDLCNCIVFSQKGFRDLPSMLSGGDLDGDMYNIIFNKDLIPPTTVSPAAYTPAKPNDIGRPVNADDMTAFFIDFMQNDQLGRIATLHQVLADRNGTSSSDCILLAELHSAAVDFSKSGVPVELTRIPRADRWRPDFMAPSASTKVEKGITRATLPVTSEDDRRYRYYPSDKILGKLYRAVNEDVFFQSLEEDTSSMFSTTGNDTGLEDVLKWILQHIPSSQLKSHLDCATEVRNYYESNMLEIMLDYAVARNDPLTEKEVVIGTILGRTGAGSRRQQEQSTMMRSRFSRDLQDIRSWMETRMTNVQDGFLLLAAACVFHAVNHRSNVDTSLSSFGWMVAAMCVPNLMHETEGSVDHLQPN